MFEAKFVRKFCWSFNHKILSFVFWTFEFAYLPAGRQGV
jgi:hypothetical protein